MEYINNDEILNEKIKLKYSTLNEYFNEKEKDLISINNIMKIFSINWTEMFWIDFFKLSLHKRKICESISCPVIL